ncbi:MAG: hypothetical protein JWM11_3527 [Planctomycetaceae bacterium]|nr:hypothetical protein [Planctomycetaceae bacterium]
MLDQFQLKSLLQQQTLLASVWQSVNRVDRQMKAIEIVQNGHVKGRRDRPLFFVATNMDIVVVGPAIGQAVNQPGVCMECENDRFVCRKQSIELLIA